MKRPYQRLWCPSHESTKHSTMKHATDSDALAVGIRRSPCFSVCQGLQSRVQGKDNVMHRSIVSITSA